MSECLLFDHPEHSPIVLQGQSKALAVPKKEATKTKIETFSDAVKSIKSGSQLESEFEINNLVRKLSAEMTWSDLKEWSANGIWTSAESLSAGSPAEDITISASTVSPSRYVLLPQLAYLGIRRNIDTQDHIPRYNEDNIYQVFEEEKQTYYRQTFIGELTLQLNDAGYLRKPIQIQKQRPDPLICSTMFDRESYEQHEQQGQASPNEDQPSINNSLNNLSELEIAVNLNDVLPLKEEKQEKNLVIVIDWIAMHRPQKVSLRSIHILTMLQDQSNCSKEIQAKLVLEGMSVPCGDNVKIKTLNDNYRRFMSSGLLKQYHE